MQVQFGRFAPGEETSYECPTCVMFRCFAVAGLGPCCRTARVVSSGKAVADSVPNVFVFVPPLGLDYIPLFLVPRTRASAEKLGSPQLRVDT